MNEIAHPKVMYIGNKNHQIPNHFLTGFLFPSQSTNSFAPSAPSTAATGDCESTSLPPSSFFSGSASSSPCATRYCFLFSASSTRRCRCSRTRIELCCTCIRHTENTCEIVPTGDVSRPDQDGSRCANGEVALKFVVKVNPAQEIRTLCMVG